MTVIRLREFLEPSLLELSEIAAHGDSSNFAAVLRDYQVQLTVVNRIAEQRQLRGLSHVATLLHSGLEHLINGNMDPDAVGRAVLSDWPTRVLTEVMGPGPGTESSPWSVLHRLRQLPWFPKVPYYLVELIETRLGEDAQRFVEDELATVGEPVFEMQAVDAPEPLTRESSLAMDTAVHSLGGAMDMTTDAWAIPDDPLEGDVDGLVEPPESGSDDGPDGTVAPEELAMMSEALGALHEEFKSQFGNLPQGEALAQLGQQYGEQLDNILNAAAHLGLEGLQNVIGIIQINTLSLQDAGDQPAGALLTLLADWPERAMAYLAAPTDEAAARALADVAANPAWPHPAGGDVIAQWIGLLTSVQVVTVRAGAQRAEVALSEHMDLTVPSDIDRNVLDSLLIELPRHALEFSARVQRLVEGGTLEDVDHARRVAHTLKGAGNTVGVKGVGNLTHVLEDILVACEREKKLPAPQLCEVLIEAADCLEEMGEALLGKGGPPAQSLAVYQKVLDWANRIDREGLPDADTEVPTLAAPGALMAPPVSQETEITTAQDPEAYLRVSAALIDSQLNLTGEDSIIVSQLQDRIAKLTEDLNAQRIGSRRLRQLASELEQLVDVRGLAMIGGGTGELDALEMDQYNELHMLSRRIVEASTDTHEFSLSFEREVAGLSDLMAAKERLLINMQQGLQRTRMVEVASVAPRLLRTVRQAARVLKKSVQLDIVGDSTLVDTQLLDRLLDPLMHMLRNAVDHGIEPAETRMRAEKPALGTVTLTFSSGGSNLAVRCEDDGGGLDVETIRVKAEKAGLINDTDHLTQSQIMRLILLPGFSTRDQATMTSGRGIGMDVVQRAVNDLRGTLELQSKPGAGSRFEMSFPMNLSAAKVMISRSPRHLLAISERRLDQLLPLDDSLRTEADGSLSYLLQDTRIPAHRLEHLLHLPTHALRHPGVNEVLMIVRDENRQSQAIVVPEISESRSVVVKPINALLPRAVGIDGVTILGDGSVASVIDLPDLLRHFQDDLTAPRHSGEMAPELLLPLCLVVDDSISVRRTMEQLMQDAGYEVLSARDGLDALDVMQRRVPDIVLVDLEMPRMNGLELTNTLRNRNETKSIPVIMITSRFTDKHHQLAKKAGVNAFLTKPYTEAKLLNIVDDLLRDQAGAQIAA